MNQFKKLFPVSAVTSRLMSAEKINITLKLNNYWGESTLSDLTKLVSLFGIPSSHFHLKSAGEGSIVVHWLCSVSDAKELKGAIFEAADTLQTKGVLQVFIGEELVLECSQPDQGILKHNVYMYIKFYF